MAPVGYVLTEGGHKWKTYNRRGGGHGTDATENRSVLNWKYCLADVRERNLYTPLSVSEQGNHASLLAYSLRSTFLVSRCMWASVFSNNPTFIDIISYPLPAFDPEGAQQWSLPHRIPLLSTLQYLLIESHVDNSWINLDRKNKVDHCLKVNYYGI